MSQNRHKTEKFNAELNNKGTMGSLWVSFERAFYSLILFAVVGMFLFAASSAQAAVSKQTKTKVGKNPSYILKADLASISKRNKALLDWRTQSYTLNFDLPAHDWYEDLDLFLSVYPDGHVTRGTPIMISYNGAKPVPIYGRGSRFDAHITLSTSRIRLSRNSIQISYSTPTNNACLTENDGQWVVDLNRSKLVAKVRAKRRNMEIIEIEQRLAHAMTAPKRVSIIAKGEQQLAYKALAAQAVAMRMDFVPEFKLGSGIADMQVLIGTHDDIKPLLNNPRILETKGAQVALDSGATPKIVLTAETEAQVLKLSRAFATYHLPKARRGNIRMQELVSNTRFETNAIVDAQAFKLSDIGTAALTPSWRPDAAQVNFNVRDAHATNGKVVLKIISAKDIDKNSKLSVMLNNKSIGYTHLNKSSKKVEFPIKSGMLLPTKNTLSIAPTLAETPNGDDSNNGCASTYIPSIMVSGSSKVHFKSNRPSPLTDLSRFAASGAPFDTNSVLILNAKSLRDQQSTLQLLGYAAQQFGPKWANADYIANLPSQGSHDAAYLDRNILIIGPKPMADAQVFRSAPKALKLAYGKRFNGQQESQYKSGADKYASRDANQIFTSAAQRGQSARLKSGGIAAMFPNPYGKGKLIGIISADRPSKFSGAIRDITQTSAWNALQGSVARWDNKSVLMAQTATPLPAGFMPAPARKQNPATAFFSSTKNWFTSLKLPARPGTKPATPVSVQNSPSTSTPAPLNLRGVSPSTTNSKVNPAPSQQKSSLGDMKVNLKGFKPNMTKLKLKGYQVNRDLKSWWKSSSTSAFEATEIRTWWKEITHNRTAFLLLVVFLAFFITALFSPIKIPRKKESAKRLYPAQTLR